MRSTFTFVFLVILFILNGNSQIIKKNHQDHNAILTEIDTHHFGASIISTIAVHKATAGTLTDIEDSLNKINSDLDNEQKTEKAEFEKRMQKCEEDQSHYNEQITSHTTGLENANTKLEAETKALKLAEQALVGTLGDISSTEGKITSGDAQRKAENEEWKGQDQEHTDAIAALDEASVLVAKLKDSPSSSFAQLKDRFAQVNQKLSDQKIKHSLYQPIILALSQIATKADQGTVAKILELLESLKTDLTESQKLEKQDEDKLAEAWKNLKEQLQSDLSDYMQRRDDLNIAIDGHKNAIVAANKAIDRHTKGLAKNEKLLKSSIEICTLDKENFEKDDKERLRELSILKTLIDYFTANVGSLEEYLKVRKTE